MGIFMMESHGVSELAPEATFHHRRAVDDILAAVESAVAARGGGLGRG